MTDTFHYPPILLELTQALQHVLQANDWHEGKVASADAATQQQQERGNLQVAAARIKNAYQVVTARLADLEVEVRLAEAPQMAKLAEYERIAQGVPDDVLPPELRRATPEVSPLNPDPLAGAAGA